MSRQQTDVIMKTYVIASVIFGLISGGICSDVITGNETTTDIANTTLPANITSTEPVSTTITVEPTTGNATTVEPSTTTPTTPLPTPGPRKDPVKGNWIVKSDKGFTCLRLNAAIQFKFTYEQQNEKFVDTFLNVPKNASKNESSCEQQVLTLEFDGNSFSLKFVHYDGKVFAKQADLYYIINTDVFPGAKDSGPHNVTAHNLTLFSVPKGKSYLCRDASNIDFGNNVTGTLTDIQVEAFKNSTNDDFSEADECSSDKISDIVPIAVGCALAALVIIVLIAYLVGRRRTRQRGYQSV